MFFSVSSLGAQSPEVEWRRSDWFPTHPVEGKQTQEENGEDWWYDHANSYVDPKDPLSELQGFVAAGFSNFVNWQEVSEESSNGCMRQTLRAWRSELCEHFETEDYRKGPLLTTIALIDKDPTKEKPIWFNAYVVGEFYRVIQTRDGGYLAVGFSPSTRDTTARDSAGNSLATGAPLFYNPNRTPGELTDSFDDGNGCTLDGADVPHLVATKTDAQGRVEWQYLYGIAPYRDVGGEVEPAYKADGRGRDVVETPSGNFIIVGQSVADPSATFNCNNEDQPVKRALLLEVTPEGHWVSSKVMGPSDVHSLLTSIAQYDFGGEVRYVVSGYTLVKGSEFNPFIGCDYYQKAFVTQLDSDFNVEWTTTGFNADSPNSINSNQSTEDIAVTTPLGGKGGEILVPLVVNCKACLYSGYNTGPGRVYRLNPADGSIVGISETGSVTAFDLKLRVTPTADGGFAAVSSKKLGEAPPAPQDGCDFYKPDYWGSDAYVAKFNPSGVLEWETTFDAEDQRPAVPDSFPLDRKQQECVYTITEQPDGGLVISGNNSYNFDDSYLAKLGPPPPSPGPDLSIQDTPRDVGLEPNPDGGPMWVSEDIWVRHDPDGGFAHQNPVGGSANTVYVRVTNRGDTPADGELKVYWAKASTGLGWPDEWEDNQELGLLFGDQIPVTVPIVGLAGGASEVYAVPWQVPVPGAFPSGPDQAHFCLLARIETAGGPDFGMTFQEGESVYANTRNNNNVAWKNVTIVEAPMKKEFVLVRNVADEPAEIRLQFGARRAGGSDSETFLDHGLVEVELGPELYSRWTEGGGHGDGIRGGGGNKIVILKPTASVERIPMEPGEAAAISVAFNLKTRPDEPVQFDFDVVQYSTVAGEETLVGGQRFSLPLEETLEVDLAVEVSDGLTTATSGQGVVYTVDVSNEGASAALGAVVSLVLPEGLSGGTWTCGAPGGSACGGAGAGDLHDVIDLQPGHTITYSLSATIAPTFFGRLASTAEVVEPSGTRDVDRSDNRSTDETIVLPSTGLAGSKEVSGVATAGGTVTYTILLLNGGPAAQLDNPGDEFVDILPPELQPLSATASSGATAIHVPTRTVTWNGSVAPGGVVTLTVKATVAPGTAAGTTISNQGTISFDSNGNGTNDASSQTDDPGLPGSSDATTFRVAGVLEIPTLSPTALWVLSLTFLGMGLWRLSLGGGR